MIRVAARAALFAVEEPDAVVVSIIIFLIIAGLIFLLADSPGEDE